eukprot:5855587-Amphidinium_carterae.1
MSSNLLIWMMRGFVKKNFIGFLGKTPSISLASILRDWPVGDGGRRRVALTLDTRIVSAIATTRN